MVSCISVLHGDILSTISTDIDECDLDIDNCDENARCTNTIGSFVCECLPGFTGDGVTCDGELPFDTRTCDHYRLNLTSYFIFLDHIHLQILMSVKRAWITAMIMQHVITLLAVLNVCVSLGSVVMELHVKVSDHTH